MELEDIVGQISNINGDQAFRSADDMASFLRICGNSLVNYLEYTSDKLGVNSPEYLPRAIDHIRGVFFQLSENYFPMAHSNQPIHDLVLCERRQLEQTILLMRELLYRSEELQQLALQLGKGT
jgi:hypothetical protein